MDDLIRIRSGDLNGRSEMPSLKHAEVIDGKKRGTEIGYHEAEKALYAGTPDGNLRLCGAEDVALINAEIGKVLTEISYIQSRLEKLEKPSE